MPNKNIDPKLGSYPQEETMSKSEIEQYFTAIKEDLDEFKNEVMTQFLAINERMEKVEKIAQSILEIVKVYDAERKEIKSTLWEFDRRLLKLERRSV